MQQNKIHIVATRSNAVGKINWNWHMIVLPLGSAWGQVSLLVLYKWRRAIRLICNEWLLDVCYFLFNFMFILRVSLTLYFSCFQNKHWVIEKKKGMSASHFFITISTSVFFSFSWRGKWELSYFPNKANVKTVFFANLAQVQPVFVFSVCCNFQLEFI